MFLLFSNEDVKTNDYKQWYIDTRFSNDVYYLSNYPHINIPHRKLTTEEIIEHFDTVERLANVGLRRGRLTCYDCVHDYNCERKNRRCEANVLYNNQVWHKIDKENCFYKRNRLGKDGRILWS